MTQSEELKQTQQKLTEAVVLINKNVMGIRRWANPNSFMGKEMEDLANENAFFLSQHPLEQNDYLRRILDIQKNMDIINNKDITVITDTFKSLNLPDAEFKK